MTGDRGFKIRRATRADVPALAGVLDANGVPIGWPDRAGWPYVEHVIGRARTIVAEIPDAEGIAGFGASVTVGRDDIRLVTDLFVHPEHQDRGIGRTLLTGLIEDATDRLCFSSDDDRAWSLYLRAGMRPWWPLLFLTGEVPEVDLDDVVETADVTRTASWSRAWTGVDRTPDFAHYATLPDAEGFLIWDAGAVAAVAWARRHRTRPGRWLDHASFAPDADPLRVARLVLAAAGDGDQLTAPIPGPHPVAGWWLENDGEIISVDTLCATDPDLVDPERLFPNPGFV